MKIQGEDCRGHKRGCCTECDCENFEYDDDKGVNCSYCLCSPTKHMRLGKLHQYLNPNSTQYCINISAIFRDKIGNTVLQSKIFTFFNFNSLKLILSVYTPFLSLYLLPLC